MGESQPSENAAGITTPDPSGTVLQDDTVRVGEVGTKATDGATSIPDSPATPWTPGPWTVRTRTTGLLGEISPFHQVLAGEENLGVYPFQDADARLIAAAPEMAELLEVLDDLMANLPWGTDEFFDGVQSLTDRGSALLSRIRGEA